MHTFDPLIRTKLRQPFIRPRLVVRERLQEHIAEGLHGPLTLVVAPAGFGKTTLVAASLAGCHWPVAWLSLDRGDNQAERFLSYLVAALQSADDRIGREAVQLMTGVPSPQPEAVLTSLINDLDMDGGEMVLVLDDYQFISSPDVHTGVTFLLEHCPPTFHLLIATRSDPPLPLARMRARGQLVELRTADLRFTPAEAARFLNDNMELGLDSQSVAVLEERTEGWIAGLQMAALSMRDRQDVPAFIEGFSGTHRHILDYLLEETLAGQPPAIQHFLLQTSVLERFCAELCDAVVESREWRVESSDYSPLSTLQSREILDHLDRSNLFLIPLDDERTWFRYHHLFADLLKVRLQQAQPDLVPVLHLRASVWLEQNGFIAQAIQHLLAAQEMDRAADLIERYGPGRLAEGDPSVFQMADSLPQEQVLARPKIGLYQAWLLIIRGRIDKARPLLIAMQQHLAGADLKPGRQWMQTIIASAVAFLSPPADTPEVDPLPDDALLEKIPPEETILRNAAEFLYGMTLARRGEFDRAVEVAVRCIQREKTLSRASPQGTQAIPTLAPFLSRIYLMLGRLHAAADLCREFLDPIRERGSRFIYTSGSMKIDLGEVLYEWNCLEEAERHIRDGLQTNEPWKNVMTDGFGLSALTRVLMAKGDYSGALQAVERFETRLQEHSRPREFDEDFRTLRVRVKLASGDLKGVSDWADQVSLSEDYICHACFYRLTLARIRLAQGRYAAVEELLAEPASPPGIASRKTRQLEAILLLAAAIAGQNRLPEALELVDACLAQAEPEGNIRIFLGVGEPARDLVAAYLRSEAPGHLTYARKILDAFPSIKGAGARFPHPDVLVEPLSDRELEVLQLIALGKTNPEIARQLVVSPGTVKAHSASIYRKLDVANRTEAVARARQLGLLP